MIEIIELIADRLEIVIYISLGLITAAALIRTAIKASRGESVKVPPVGIVNDLPGSVTGIVNTGIVSERSLERADEKNSKED